jgi:glycosyltransferase involved in cell wall biosynthesis
MQPARHGELAVAADELIVARSTAGVGTGRGAHMSEARKLRVAVLTGNSLCHNPRALKEASAFARAGHDVAVLGAWLDPALKARDVRLMQDIPFAFYPVLDFTLPGVSDRLARLLRRAGKRAVQVVHDLTGLQSPFQLGFGIRRLLKHALAMRADLYIAHSESCLQVGRELLRRGRRVGVDMEDWYSEDLLPEARRHRPLGLLKSLERKLLLRGAHATCPSHAMSAALAAEYGCAPPAVVYNAFAWSERQALDGAARDRSDTRLPSICWYSQTIGPGRGLEDLLAALPLLKHDAEIHLRGNPASGFREWANARVPERWRQRMFFHPLVPNDELLSRVAEHDIGFAGEMKYCRSRDLTVTNKIMHYLLGGLAVVASDTAGQNEVAAQASGAVLLYPSGDAAALADVLNPLLASPERMRAAKAAALRAAQETFCWERQEPRLLDAVAAAAEGHGRAGSAARMR